LNYYNEFDPFAAAWLIELIKAGLIPNGVVDDRSIVDIDPQDLTDFTQCHFFAGIGGWSRALFLANWPEERPVWTGSCPCQPFSVAGKQEGIHDERHLAPVWLDLIRECRPPVIFGEQVASAIEHGWFDTLQNDLENEKYTCAMVVLPACSVKAPHLRQRLWFVAERVGFSNCAGPNAGRKRSSPPRHRYSFIATSSNGGLGFSNFPRPQRRGLRGDDANQRPFGASSAVNGLAEPPRKCVNRGGEIGAPRGDEHTDSFDDGGLAEPASFGRRQEPENFGRGLERTATEENTGRPHNSSLDSGAHQNNGFWSNPDWLFCQDERWRPVESGTFPLDDGVSRRVGKLRGYGNAIVPQVAKEIIEVYMEFSTGIPADFWID
jgi:DNA (cytosine-5)-methyltransferase 1